MSARCNSIGAAVMNAANEAAVAAFLDTKISFLEIAALVRQTMEAHTFIADPELESVLSADGWARKHVQQRIAGGGP